MLVYFFCFERVQNSLMTFNADLFMSLIIKYFWPSSLRLRVLSRRGSFIFKRRGFCSNEKNIFSLFQFQFRFKDLNSLDLSNTKSINIKYEITNSLIKMVSCICSTTQKEKTSNLEKWLWTFFSVGCPGVVQLGGLLWGFPW